MDEEIICFCKSVTKEEIIDNLTNNRAVTFDEIKNITKASTGCGRCANYVKSIIEKNINIQND